MRLGELIENADIVSSCADLDLEISGVSCDSRTVGAGEVFIAISGHVSDGHRYIDEAVKKGAVCVICEEAPVAGTSHIVVEDSRKAHAVISAAWFGHPADKLKIIGVTGTNGKTTVTTLIKMVIEECSSTKAGLIGTNWNMIGDRELPTERTTPGAYEVQELFAMMLKEGCQYVVMEVSSHAIQQNRVFGIEFEIGIFTNLSADHLDYHASMEDYSQTKARMFENCRRAVVNLDDEYASVMINTAKGEVFTYAVKDGNADLVAKNIKLHSDRVDFSVLSIGSLSRVEISMPGVFTIYNALAVISTTMLMGFKNERIIRALQACKGVKGRAEVVPVGQDYTVLIDYAHTPDALENIITACREFARGRVVTLFGCGGDRDKTKRPQMGTIAADCSDFVIVTSDNPRTEEPKAIINEILAGMESTKTPYCVIENRREAIFWALDNAKTDDVLILAGKGHEMYQILGKEKIHFDEREIVADYYNSFRKES